MERSYTIKELDALRAAVRERYRVGQEFRNFGNTSGWVQPAYVSGDPRAAADSAARTSQTEELVRTHMLAGHSAEDVRAAMAEDEAA